MRTLSERSPAGAVACVSGLLLFGCAMLAGGCEGLDADPSVRGTPGDLAIAEPLVPGVERFPAGTAGAGAQAPGQGPALATSGRPTVASAEQSTPVLGERVAPSEGGLFGTERFVFQDVGTGEVQCDITWELTSVGPALGCDECVWATRVNARYLGDEGDGSCADRQRDLAWSYGLRVDPVRGAVLMFDEGTGWREWMEVQWDGRHLRYDGRRSSEPVVIDGVTYELEFGYRGDVIVEVVP